MDYWYNAGYKLKKGTAKKEIEKLSLVAQRTNNGVIISDNMGKVQRVNTAFTSVTGYGIEYNMGRRGLQYFMVPILMKLLRLNYANPQHVARIHYEETVCRTGYRPTFFLVIIAASGIVLLPLL